MLLKSKVHKLAAIIMNEELGFEFVVCNICGNTQYSPVFSGPDRLTGMPGSFHLVQCNECSILLQNPRLVWDQLKGYYPDADYTAYETTKNNQPSKLKIWVQTYGIRKWLKAIEKIQPTGKLLDIGCGIGTFLSIARSSGWEVEGVEPNAYAADYVRDVLKIPVQKATFPETKLPFASYDIITMWNVLEHLPEPIQSIQSIHRLLKPGGWLILSLPNVESLEARYAHKYWVGWDLPRHLYLFPKENLQKILHQNGFVLQKTRCLSTSYSALGLTLNFWLQDSKYKHKKIAPLLVQLYHLPLIRVMLMPLFWILDRQQLSSIITIFAQKVDK
jgi:2-polyprenyl-3-methyl-5-hydroxy-6-metoxy-1,4-benzoquinol methylase